MRFCSRGMGFAVAVLIVTGCQTSDHRGRTVDAIPHLSTETAAAAGLSADQVSAAADLYTSKCAKCHKFYDPAQYSQADWDMWMRKMSRKSKLKPDDERLLSRYLAAYRANTH